MINRPLVLCSDVCPRLLYESLSNPSELPAVTSSMTVDIPWCCPVSSSQPHSSCSSRENQRADFSRRRAFRDSKDIDYINDRNAHFNKKIERAFGKYTAETKANLERGTALPDR